MSQENLELVVRALTAILRRPKPDFETANTLYHRDHVLVSIAASTLGEAEARGAPGYKAWLQEMESALPYEADLNGAVDIGHGQVLAVTTVRFHGAASGIGGERRVWNLVTVADGQITRTESYLDPAEALAAADRRE